MKRLAIVLFMALAFMPPLVYAADYNSAYTGAQIDSGAKAGNDVAGTTGIIKSNGSGTIGAASSGTDYAPATSGSAILKGNGSGGFSSASSGTDYAPATSGSAILKGNGSGGFSSASAGTDYCGPMTTIDCSAGCTPTAAQLQCGAILQNYGQGASNINVTLPTIGAGMAFRVDIGTTQAANYFRTTSAAGANMGLDDLVTGKDYVQFSAPTQEDGYSCISIQTGASTWKWRCYTRKGATSTN